MAVPGYTVLIPKSEPDEQTETEYDKKIQAELDKRMTDCCDGGRQVYDHYGYKPRPKNFPQEIPAQPESIPAAEPPENAPPTDKKNSKR